MDGRFCCENILHPARCETTKKGAGTKAAPGTPTKGHIRTAPGPAPLSGRGQALLLMFKSPTAQVGRFLWKQKLDAYASFKLSVGPFVAALCSSWFR